MYIESCSGYKIEGNEFATTFSMKINSQFFKIFTNYNKANYKIKTANYKILFDNLNSFAYF